VGVWLRDQGPEHRTPCPVGQNPGLPAAAVRGSPERLHCEVSRRYIVTVKPLSIRFSDSLYDRLKRFAARSGEPLSTVAQQAVSEWLDMAEHPGVVFRGGPTGRRAALAAGPDIWEVAAVLAQQDGSPEDRLARAAEQLGLPFHQVELAAAYWAAHRVEIDRRLAANREAADRELVAWEQRRALLGA